MKAQLNILRLSYPPISNQEAEWLKDDPEVQSIIKNSNLYMIGQKPESFFEFEEKDINKIFLGGKLNFLYCCNGIKSEGYIDLEEAIKKLDLDKEQIDIELGPKMIRFWKMDKSTNEEIEVIMWFTTDKILWDKWRGHPAVKGIDNYKQFTIYFLHYVGISKEDDSLKRLVINPHDKRLRILSNEYPMLKSSRLTDETVLFFFEIETITFTTLDNTDYENIEEILLMPEIEFVKICADAEKAFVKIMDSQYNKVKFKNYPKGKDGLYGDGLTRYGYVIGEDILFQTHKEVMRGKYINNYKKYLLTDMILIEGDNVTLIKK